MTTDAIENSRGGDQVSVPLLAAAPVLMALVDLALTLTGQRPEYWAGDYSAVLEANPLARFFMLIHPGMMIGAFAVYLLIITCAICRLPRSIGEGIALLVLLAHTFGASTWLLRWPGGMFYCVGVWLVARWLAGKGRPRFPSRRGLMPSSDAA